MNIAIRTKFGDCAGAKEKVASGFSEVAITQRNDAIRAFADMGPNAIYASLPSVPSSDRAAGFVDQSNTRTE